MKKPIHCKKGASTQTYTCGTDLLARERDLQNENNQRGTDRKIKSQRARQEKMIDVLSLRASFVCVNRA